MDPSQVSYQSRPRERNLTGVDVSMELSSGIKPAAKAATKSRKDEEESSRPAERKGASDTSKKFTTVRYPSPYQIGVS
jgi:hypothetical protein